MNSATRVGVVREGGLEEGIQKELSLEELPSPYPRQTGQGAGDGLSKQKQLWGGCEGGCVLEGRPGLVDAAQGGLFIPSKGTACSMRSSFGV